MGTLYIRLIISLNGTFCAVYPFPPVSGFIPYRAPGADGEGLIDATSKVNLVGTVGSPDATNGNIRQRDAANMQSLRRIIGILRSEVKAANLKASDQQVRIASTS